MQNYFMGEISRPDYRRQRHDLIDKIVDTRISLTDFKLPSSEDASNINAQDINGDDELDDLDSQLSNTQPYDSKTGQFQWNNNPDQPNNNNPASGRSKSGIDKWFVVAIIIVVVYLGFSLFSESDGALQVSGDTPDSTIQFEKVKHPKDLVIRFSQLSTWSDAEIDNFIARWRQLPVVQREDAKSAPWFHQFNLQIKKRYEQYKQQAQTGSNDAARMQLILLQLANAINT